MSVPRRVPGDPLTGAVPVVPATQVHIRQAVEVWPHKPDPEAIVYSQLHRGAFVWVRTPRGIRQWQLRLVRKAQGYSKQRGRRFIVAHDKQSRCHVAWLDQVIRVQPKLRELMP